MSRMEYHTNSESPDSFSSVKYDRYGFCGGKEFTDPNVESRLPVKVIRAREMKWREMCNNWEQWSKHHRNKLINRCRKGIPDSMRCEAWQRLCNSPMVLVARPKVFSSAPDAETQTNTKSFFGTLGRRNTSRSLPTVITTSPSFRIKRGGKDKDRRQYLLKKLYGNNVKIPQISPLLGSPTINSPAISTKTRFSSTNAQGQRTLKTGDSGGGNFSVPPNAVYRWPRAEPNGDSFELSGIRGAHLDNESFHSLLYDTDETMPYSTGTAMTMFSPYTAAASVHDATTTVPCFAVIPSASTVGASGSGGYASLSTNSATDSASIQNLPMEPVDSNFADSCASSLRLSSFDSSSSVLWLQNQSADATMSNQDLTELEDARATLVPALDPDPVALYEQYCMQEGVPTNCDQIRRDIDRQFPFHELFNEKGGHGQESLYTLLKAYTIRHSDKGYCQGQAPLAAVLLMFMPEVDAFWTFNEVCERYLVSYYDDGLERIQIDAEILYALLKSIYPPIYKHLKSNGVDPLFIVVEWFMCVFTRTLPWATVLRVLDMFFCEGKVVMFRVGIVLLHRLFGTRALRKAYPSMEDIMSRLREVQSVVPDASDFVRETLRLELSPRDVAQEAIRQSHKWDRKKKLEMASEALVV